MTRNGDLERTLQQLEEEERVVSRERARLHRRLEFIAGGGSGSDDIATHVEQERAVSARRKELHRLIDETRTQLGLELWKPQTRPAHERLD